ncbi:MAG: phospholipase D-like domain-containing protein [Planctomycetota bacterium]
MLDRIWRSVVGKPDGNGTEPAGTGGGGPVRIVMSVPHEHRDAFFPRVPGISLTYDVLAELFRSAKKEIRIFSPFIDATFTNLAIMTEVPIRVLTTVRERKQKSVGVVERCAASRDVTVRYIHQKKQDAHLYQLHAKMVLVDGEMAYVGSANLTDSSIHYNFELGFLIRDEATVQSLARTFDYLFDHVGFPAKVA